MRPYCAGWRRKTVLRRLSRHSPGFRVFAQRMDGQGNSLAGRGRRSGRNGGLAGQFWLFFGQHVSQGMDTGIRRIARLPGQGLETEPETVIFPENMAGKGNETGMPG